MQNQKKILSALLFILLISIPLSVINTEEIAWSNEFQLTEHTDNAKAPSITQTINETIWVVWHSSREGNYDIYYTTSDDYGANWSNDTRLTTNSSADKTPSITQTADGKIWIVWSSNRTGDYNIFYKTSSDSGSTWSSEEPLTTDPNFDLSPSITQTANGTIWVVWQSDRIQVQGKSQDDLFYKTSSDGGATWSNDTRLTNDTEDDIEPSITQTIDDKIWVTWVSNRNGTRDIFYKTSSDGGTTWSDDFQLTGDTGDEWNPSITQNNGTIWIVWYSAKTGNYEIYYATSDDGGANWSNERRLTVTAGFDITPSITQTANGTIWIIWTSDRAGNYDIWYKTTIHDDSQWGADLDHDGDVDREDVVLFAGSYNSSIGNKGYSPDADYDDDGDVDIHDLTLFLIYYYGARA